MRKTLSTCMECIWHVNLTVVLIEDFDCLELMHTNDSGTFLISAIVELVSDTYIKGA